MNHAAMFFIAGALIPSLSLPTAAGQATAPGKPTTESALEADQQLAHAIQANDANAIVRMLDPAWVVIDTAGGVGEGPSIFPVGIKSGYLTRTSYELSEPRVRLYGDTALVTSKVHTAGSLQGKPFDVLERQTDVWRWANGGWICVLTHETKIKNS